MVAGDAHRVWFPEMVEHLRLCWRDDLSMGALLGLRDDLEEMLTAMPQRQNRVDAQGARMPTNAEAKSARFS